MKAVLCRRLSESNFVLLLRHVRRQRIWFVLALAGTGGLALTMLLMAHVLRHGIDALIASDFSGFQISALTFLIVVALICVFTVMERLFVGYFAENSIADIRRELVWKMNRLPMGYLETQHSGDLTSRVTNDLNVLREFLLNHMLELVFMPLMGTMAFLYMLTVSWALTGATLVLIPLFGWLVAKVAVPMQRRSGELQTSLGQVNSEAQDTIAGLDVVKAFNLQAVQDEKYQGKVKDSVYKGLRLAKLRSAMEGLSSIAGIAPFFVSFGFGGFLAVSGVITVGGWVSFINLLNHVTHPLHSLPNLIGQANQAMAAYGRVREVLGEEEESQGGTVEAMNPEAPALEFQDVVFRYEQEPVLDHLSLTIEKGQTVALVGPSGGGKSTMIKLLPRFYDAEAGTIQIGGTAVEAWNLAALRRQMALVNQETYLYPGTVAENIGHGRPDASLEEIQKAASLAHADAFIRQLPQGYQTVIGERGSTLSGGQRQRIAIARAVLKDAPILLLDEPTSALDTESEAWVQQALDRLMARKTTVVVAHRLSTIKNADWVVVLDNGRVAEEGTHEDLLAAEGLYCRLYRTQFSGHNGQRQEAVS